MTARPLSASVAALVDVLVRSVDGTLRDRLLLEACLEASGAQAGSVWRREEGRDWELRVERGPRTALPATAAIAAVLASEADPSLHACILRATSAARGLAIALSETADETAAELEGLLNAVLLVEASIGEGPSEPPGPLPSLAGPMRALQHDVRNALAGLTATRQVLERLGDDLSAEEGARFRAAIERECSRAATLLARGLGGPEHHPRVPATAAQIVRDVLDMERAAFHRTGLAARLDVSSEAEALVPALAGEDWARAVRNLIANAREACGSPSPAAPEGIRVSLSLVPVPQATLRLLVEDRGVGLPPVPLPRLFHPGFTSGKPGGTGQGLAAVREIVHAAGGALLVQRLERGARFEVWIPAAGSA